MIPFSTKKVNNSSTIFDKNIKLTDILSISPINSFDAAPPAAAAAFDTVIPYPKLRECCLSDFATSFTTASFAAGGWDFIASLTMSVAAFLH